LTEGAGDLIGFEIHSRYPPAIDTSDGMIAATITPENGSFRMLPA
jgi:hypothetical protein